MDERERWNAHYASRVNMKVKDPPTFLREHLALLPRGHILEWAMGEGHNAIFPARQGFAVTAIDISDVAVERAVRLSQAGDVAVNTQCTDLRSTTLTADTYDVVACFSYLQRDLFPQIVSTLKGGHGHI